MPPLRAPRRSPRLNPYGPFVSSYNHHPSLADVEEESSVVGHNTNLKNTTPFDNPDPPFQFIPGQWYRPLKAYHLKGICRHHVPICERAKVNVLLSTGYSAEVLKEKVKIFHKDIYERQRKITKLNEEWNKLPHEEEEEEEEEEEVKKTKKNSRKKKTKEELEEEEFQKVLQEFEKEKEEEKKKKAAEEEKETITRVEEEEEEEEETKDESEDRTAWGKIMMMPRWTIKKDEKYNISKLLSSTERDYLVNHKGCKVKIEDLCLSSKYVLLYFTYLPSKDNTYHFKFNDAAMVKSYSDFIQVLQSSSFADINNSLNLDLKETYTTHQPKGLFEVVFVALGTNEYAFRDSFNCVPGFAIPYDDQNARDSIERMFHIPPEPMRSKAVLFDKEGRVVLLDDAWFKIVWFGSRGFPFTEKRLDDMCNDGAVLFDQLVLNKNEDYLTRLLGDCVILPNGDKLSTTSAFKGKIVALYFFELSPLGFSRTVELLDIWNHLKHRKGEEMKIVFIYKDTGHPSIAEEAFKKEFKFPIPWYRLPSDGTGRQVCRVFQHCRRWSDCSLIILKPDKYHSVSFFAFEIFKEFGYSAYPFTVEKVVQLTMRKQRKSLVLHKLLSPKALLCRGGPAGYMEKTTVSKLSGKCVLLLFATDFCYNSGSFLLELIQIYNENNDDFEIIYISLGCDESESTFHEIIRKMPRWLVHAFISDFGVKLADKVFPEVPPELPAMAAFGPDGHLVTKESNLAFRKGCESKFPFIDADMGKEVHRALLQKHQWHFERPPLDDRY